MLDWAMNHPIALVGILVALLIAVPAVSLGALIFVVIPTRRRELRNRLRLAAGVDT